jgi:hypothetical protein
MGLEKLALFMLTSVLSHEKKSPCRQAVVCKSFQNLKKRFIGGELVNVF